MRNRRTIAVLFLLVFSFSTTLPAQQSWQDPDPAVVEKFKFEEERNSQLMSVLSYLTDVYGPRLTGSPSLREASDYAVRTLRSWGVPKVYEETWGPFGRGWATEKIEAAVVSPQYFPLIAFPQAWTPGTNKPITADVVYAKIEKQADFESYRGKLKGKFVMTAEPREVRAHFEPQAQRFTDAELADRINPRPVPPPDEAARQRLREQRELQIRLIKFLVDERAAAWLLPSPGDGGTIFVLSGGSPDPKAPPAPPRVSVAIEHYGRIFRILAKGIPVTLEMNIQNRFYDNIPNPSNILAELPGTDKADEVVMIGAHFDSWHSGTGATDNAAGSAIMMEVMRLLKATGAKTRRTVRLALWTGEEQGLLGSRAYVAQHFADRFVMNPKPEHEKLAAYFNVDNGTGRFRGVNLQGNEALVPIFGKWMEPFRRDGMTTLSMRSPTGTDHLSFDEVGLPGFQFIQDPIEYESRTHHSNMDVYERIQEADVKQMAVAVATFVYMAANAEEKLPRKPLPAPASRP